VTAKVCDLEASIVPVRGLEAHCELLCAVVVMQSEPAVSMRGLLSLQAKLAESGVELRHQCYLQPLVVDVPHAASAAATDRACPGASLHEIEVESGSSSATGQSNSHAPASRKVRAVLQCGGPRAITTGGDRRCARVPS
jgi:hypothetical protein